MYLTIFVKIQIQSLSRYAKPGGNSVLKLFMYTFMDLWYRHLTTLYLIIQSGHVMLSQMLHPLCKTILDFEFIITLHTIERYLSYTEGLTRSLQGRATDIVAAINHIDVLKQVLTDARSDIDCQFHSLFEGASRCANKHDVSITTPRLCRRQTIRENHPASFVEEYYRRSLAIPFIDHLKSEIKSRFTEHSILALKCLKIVPSCFTSNSGISDDEMLEFLEVDCKSSAKAELEMWHTYFKDKEVLPDSPQSALEFANPMILPNIRKMLIHIMVLPVTSCEAERSFSALHRITTV